MRYFFIILVCAPALLNGQSISETYGFADIPTELNSYNASCNGPGTSMTITLPPGGLVQVTGINISYNMTAQGGGFKSHQRSQVHCQTTNTTESTVFEGTGNTGGIQPYSRNGVTIANGIFPGGTSMIFEMHAWRTAQGSGCNTSFNKVDNYTWTITLFYVPVQPDGSVGINTTNPDSSALLHLNSIQKGFLAPRMTQLLREGISNPANGLLVYDTDSRSFWHYDEGWKEIRSGVPDKIFDADENTVVHVEKNANEDIIRFELAGSEYMRLEKNTDNNVRLELLNNNDNTFIGKLSGSSHTSGLYNTSNGAFALFSNTSGGSNTATGRSALYYNTTGSENTANGSLSLYNNISGNYNSAQGMHAMYSNLQGSNNTAHGYTALYNNLIGDYNIAIGAYSGTDVSHSNTISIGNHGSLNSASNQAFIGNGSTSWIGGNVGWSTYSDARVKTNIQENVSGLDFITRLRPVTYHRDVDKQTQLTGNQPTDYYPEKYDIEEITFSGFLAQEVAQAATDSGYSFHGIRAPRQQREIYTLSYEAFVVPLVKAVQEQQTIIENQNQQIEQILSDIAVMKQQIEKIMGARSNQD